MKKNIVNTTKFVCFFIFLMIGIISEVSSQQRVQQLLDESLQAMNFPNDSNLVFQYKSVEADLQKKQSDRTYPPFFSAFYVRGTFFYPRRNTEVVNTRIVFPGYDSGKNERKMIKTSEGAYLHRKEKWVPVSAGFGSDINLNPVAVLLKWKTYKNVIHAGKRMFRDFPRIVLEHKNKTGTESLYLDPETRLPVKYEKTGIHYLWGDIRIVYIYSTWLLIDHSYFPGASFKMVDGKVKFSRTHSSMQFVSKDLLKPIPELPDPVNRAGTSNDQKLRTRLRNAMVTLYSCWETIH